MKYFILFSLVFFTEYALGNNTKELIKKVNWSELSEMPFNSIVQTSKKYYQLTFFDDFKGKPDNTQESTRCFEDLKPQCTLWTSYQGETFPCDLSHQPLTHPGYFPPVKTNLKSALYSLNPQADLETKSFAEIKSLYSNTVTEKWKHVNKCNWTSYIALNYMATDYRGKFSAKMDASQITVDPNGKGHLVISARKGKVLDDCVFGGTLSGTNCIFRDVTSSIQGPLNLYWIDPHPNYPGIYYAPINNSCPYGGAKGVNCRVFSFPTKELTKSVSYQLITTSLGKIVAGYGNNQKYGCGHSIEFPASGGVDFYPLSCPLMNGGIISQNGKAQGTSTGFSQKGGIFEVKLKIPKGIGAFPAAWLMPIKGGWPYSGGEIDIMEARDNANEIYQTYHHGKCIDSATMTELIYRPGTTELMDNEVCQKTQDAVSIQYSSDVIKKEVQRNEFWIRDHVYTAEWDDQGIKFYLNNRFTNEIAPEIAPHKYHFFNKTTDLGSPQQIPDNLKDFSPSTLPTEPFFWILNHSTWVRNDQLQNWQEQHHLIDYVKVYNQCLNQNDFCPCGGEFVEGRGCRSDSVRCPTNFNVSRIDANFYESPCLSSFKNRLCPNGGEVSGPNCQIKSFDLPPVDPGISYWVDTNPNYPGVYYSKIRGLCPFGGNPQQQNCQLRSLEMTTSARSAVVVLPGTSYWVDANPRYPGIYYAKINGSCPLGGTTGPHCQLYAFSPNILKANVAYWVDTNPAWPGVYYRKIQGQCPFGGSGTNNCRLMSLNVPDFYVSPAVQYWVDANPEYPGVYYKKINGTCPHGGSGATNCQIAAFPKATTPYLVTTVKYWVDSNPNYPGVYYSKINGRCPFGGSGQRNCQVYAFPPGELEPGVIYRVDRDPRWPGVYYTPDFR
ncbi:MAG: glycoside hydrolase family 16 protein [Bacteriovoracaceae bacterium]